MTVSFEEWHEQLTQIAFTHNGTAFAVETWKSDYAQGKTPEEAWEDKWG
jgi:hypothetical protein